MKKYLFIILMMCTLCVTAEAGAQRHRHHHHVSAVTDSIKSDVQGVGGTEVPDTNGIEAYSDTTSTPITQEESDVNYPWNGEEFDWESGDDINSLSDLIHALGSLGLGASGGLIAALVVFLAILLCMSPFLLIGFIVWLIVRNRNRRYRLAQQAMEQGQQIPDSLLKEEPLGGEDLKRRGIRNIFLGVGLAVFFSCWDASFFAGLGWLLFFYGLGQVVIARTSRKDDFNNDPRNEMEKR